MTKMGVTPKYGKNPLQNQKAYDLGTWYVALGMWGLPKNSEYDQEIPQSQTADNPVAPRGRATQPSKVCSNDGPRLTLIKVKFAF